MTENAKKITVDVPESLLQEAQAYTELGISETVRQGLELLAKQRTYKQLKSLKGKVRFSLSIDELKDDD